MTDLKEFVAAFNRIAVSRSEESVFSDFLDITICALSSGQYEEEYLAIVKKYKKEEINLFCELFARMALIMDDGGKGLVDCLGGFYQQRLSRGKHGQFFTPEHVSDMIAVMANAKDGSRILDPACGSGRMLLSAAKVSRNNYFYGADIDNTCCKMAAINLCLNGLQGEIAWMDSLGGRDYHHGGYSILYKYTPMRVPVIKKLSAGEGIIVNSAPYNKDTSENEITTIKLTQGKFDF